MPRFVPLVMGCALVLGCFAAPAMADDEDPDLPSDAGAPAAMPAMPSMGSLGGLAGDPGKLKSELGGLAGQIKSQEHHDGDPSLPRLLHVVQALRNGGKGVTADDIGMLRTYLTRIGGDSSNPELSMALGLMGQQLDTLQQQRAHPDDDPMKELGLDN